LYTGFTEELVDLLQVQDNTLVVSDAVSFLRRAIVSTIQLKYIVVRNPDDMQLDKPFLINLAIFKIALIKCICGVKSLSFLFAAKQSQIFPTFVWYTKGLKVVQVQSASSMFFRIITEQAVFTVLK